MNIKFIYLSLCFTTAFALKCFTKSDITKSNKLFTYKQKVYDSSDYSHPGGKKDILNLVGNDLTNFVNSNSKSFHLKSSKFHNDLKNMYVGVLSNTCNTQPVTQTTQAITTKFDRTSIPTSAMSINSSYKNMYSFFCLAILFSNIALYI